MTTEIKICGLRDQAALDAAIEAGADLAGFVFFERSPRNVDPALAAALAGEVRGRIRLVALTVDADDSLIDEIADTVKPDLLQFHGSESPERCRQVAGRTGLGIIKAIGVSGRRDLARTQAYAGSCAFLMLDAKPPRQAQRPGGLGEPFDWAVLAGFKPDIAWFLAGGLDPDNVENALAVSGAPGVDVSSGVESAPGVKDPELIRKFVRAARRHDAVRAA